MKRFQKIIVWTVILIYCILSWWAFVFLISSCASQKEVTTDTSLSMERQDSVSRTYSHTNYSEQWQQLQWRGCDSLEMAMTITEFFPQIDSAAGTQLVKSFKNIRLNRSSKTDIADNNHIASATEDTTAVKASSHKNADSQLHSIEKKQTKVGPDWENIILGLVIICIIILTIYLVWTAPPYREDPDDPDQGWP